MADMYYYNGVLLPEIPAEAIAEAPYCWMRHNGTEVSCFCSSNHNYLKSDGTIAPSAESIFYKYDFDAVTNLWKLYTRWGAATGGWPAINDGWNLLWSNHDIPNGSADSTSIYFPAMKAYRSVDVFTPDTVAISRERMVGIADQVRRLTGVESELTPANIEATLQGVKASGEIYNAEEFTFGLADDTTEYGITSYSGLTHFNNSNTYYGGWRFKVASAFSVKGFKILSYSGYGNYSTTAVSLYRMSDGVRVAYISSMGTIGKNSTGPVEAFLDAPVNLTVGETYAIYMRQDYMPNIHKDNVTFNPKLQYVNSIAIRTDSAATVADILANVYNNYSLCGIAFPIMGEPIGADIPTEYKVQLTTMNDITEEVQRITGTTGKMSPAQIITALQNLNITLQDKQVTPTEETQVVTPDSDYYGLSSVAVDAIEVLDDAEEVEF